MTRRSDNLVRSRVSTRFVRFACACHAIDPGDSFSSHKRFMIDPTVLLEFSYYKLVLVSTIKEKTSNTFNDYKKHFYMLYLLYLIN